MRIGLDIDVRNMDIKEQDELLMELLKAKSLHCQEIVFIENSEWMMYDDDGKVKSKHIKKFKNGKMISHKSEYDDDFDVPRKRRHCFHKN